MDKLKGKLVNVVLTIQEGKGMDSLKNVVYLSANFNGRTLDSDPVPAQDCPIFNTNLVWEIEKITLRKIRSSNQPLKVECLNIDGQNRKEKFGHVLLDLRSAQIFEGGLHSNNIPSYKWYKMIGVRNKRRNCVPELYVSLTIRSRLDDQLDLLSEDEEPDHNLNLSEPLGASSLPIKYMDDGYIKVGNQSDCNEDFSLNIVVKFVSNLDLLLPEVLVFHQNKNKYCIAIKIFGIPIKTKQFTKDLVNTVTFDEKIVVRLLSNMDVLQEFFREEKIEIGFYCGSDLLGVSVVGFEGLSLRKKVILNSCYFKFPSPNGIVPVSSDERRPVISLEIFLVKHPRFEIDRDIQNEFTSLVSSIKEDAATALACNNNFVEMLKKNDWIVEESSSTNPSKSNYDTREQVNNNFNTCIDSDAAKACGDHADAPMVGQQQPSEVDEVEPEEPSSSSNSESDSDQEQTRDLKEDLPKVAQSEDDNNNLKKLRAELERKKAELEDNIVKCRDLQEELQEKLDELKLSKALRNKRKSSLDFSQIIEENQKKFADCDKEILISYITKLQRDNDNLKDIVDEQRRELNTIRKTALTREQTNTLLQELKGLEEKFEVAQKTKTYFKEQWKRACEEVHELKTDELKLIQDQIKDRREELSQLKLDVVQSQDQKILLF